MRKIYFIIYFLLLTLPLESCQFNEDPSNKQFKKKYNKQIKEINKERDNPQKKDPLTKNIDQLLNPPEQDNNFSSKANSFDYVGINHFGSNQKKYFPDYETYEQSKFSGPESRFSPKIFEIGYNTYLNQPFAVSGVEFDFIEIPEYDSFGIKSSSSNKNYTLVPIQSLQEAIKTINQAKTAEDIEFSKKLIVDKKSLIRRKNLSRNNDNIEYVKLFEKTSNNIETAEKKINDEARF